MSYQILYDGEKIVKEKIQKKKHHIWYMTVVMFTLFLFAVFAYWPEGRETIVKLLLPEDHGNAEEIFIEQLNYGKSFGQAALVFCNQLISGS